MHRVHFCDCFPWVIRKNLTEKKKTKMKKKITLRASPAKYPGEKKLVASLGPATGSHTAVPLPEPDGCGWVLRMPPCILLVAAWWSRARRRSIAAVRAARAEHRCWPFATDSPHQDTPRRSRLRRSHPSCTSPASRASLSCRNLSFVAAVFRLRSDFRPPLSNSVTN
jgi:hypothetical protein